MNDRKKLLIVLLSCWHKEGGIQCVNKSILKFFSESDPFPEKTVLILLDNKLDIDQAVQSKPHLRNIEIQEFSGRKWKFSLVYLKNILFKKPDFVWFDHINLAPLMVCAAILNIPYSMTVHGIEVWRPMSLLQRIVVYKAKHIICPSGHTKKRAIRYSSVFKKASLCPWGLNIPKLSSSYNQTSVLGFGNRKTVLITGRMDMNEAYSKGHRELIEAVYILKERLPEILLIVVGRGSAKPVFERSVVEKKIEGNVLFTGFIPDEKIHTYYEHCDVFAMPSRGEGFGLVYLEAMAHGKPCIGSNVDATKEVISDGETGFCVDPDNIEELAERLFQLLTDSGLRKRMGQAGRKRYLENFTEQKFHERFLKLVSDV